MKARIENTRVQISGRLVLTTVPGLDFAIMPMIARYQQEYPLVEVIYASDARTFELSRGEAHVALRAGPRPTEPDNVASHLWDTMPGLYAAPDYIARCGMPERVEDLVNHRFIVGNEASTRAPFNQWLLARLPDAAFVLRTPQSLALYAAILNGIGIGFLATREGPAGLVPVLPDLQPEEWRVPIWMVTHVDLHRSPKVQSLTRFIQQEVKAGRAG